MSTALYFAADVVDVIGALSQGVLVALLWAALIVVGIAIHLPDRPTLTDADRGDR